MLITGGLFSLVWGADQDEHALWTSPYTIGFLVRGRRAARRASCAWEARQPDPMVPLAFFKPRRSASSISSVLLVGFAMFGIIYFITLYFQNVRGLLARWRRACARCR